MGCSSDTSLPPRLGTRCVRHLARYASQLDEALERLLRRVAHVRRQLDDRCVQLGLEHAWKFASFRAGDERLDGRYELQRLRIDDPRAPPRRRRSRNARTAARSPRPDAVDRAAGRFPRVVRRARPIGGLVRLDARIASDLLGALSVVKQIRSSRRSRRGSGARAVMKPATNVQPCAGQGNGFVRHAEPAAASPSASSCQSSSSQTSSAFSEDTAPPARSAPPPPRTGYPSGTALRLRAI